ncbi:hypothetical protein WISP_61214 [Willisornis vidua]|uniref:Mis18 domain-containing protein n=1 Tax=Willisornis vidua TaxID=1566151 RepID=A0ABQ9DAG5_9PASS|nr:hypothetical protein WISP_61214 [Willisornis vidua]
MAGAPFALSELGCAVSVPQVSDGHREQQQPQQQQAGAEGSDSTDLPMVFLCAGCRRPVGDTLSWVSNDEESGCILLRSAAASVSVDQERKLSKLPDECGCDIKELMRSLLTKVQATLFENKWRAFIRRWAEEMLSSTGISVVDMVNVHFGDGPFLSNMAQTTIPFSEMNTMKNLALQALQVVAEASVATLSFTQIQQRPDELFIEFAEHLKEAIAKHMKIKYAQDTLFFKLAIAQSNCECRKILRTLRVPTPMDILKAYHDVSPQTNHSITTC